MSTRRSRARQAPSRFSRSIAAMLCLALICALGLQDASARPRARKKNAARSGPRPLRVAVVLDGPLQPEWKRLFLRIQKETTLLLDGVRAVSFAAEKTVDCQWDPKKIRATLDQMLADPDVDLVLAMGSLGALDVARRKKLSKAVLAPLAVDPVFSGLPRDKSGKRSGKKNFSYLVYSSSFLEDLQTFKRLTRAKTQHVLVDRLMKKWMPALSTLSAKAKKIGVTLSLVPVDDQAKAALSAIPKDAKAIYLMPLPRLDDRERVALLSGLRARRLPTFSATGRAEVERGALATQQRGVDMLRAARRTAINIERVVRGEDPKTFSIHLTRRRKLLLNMTVARAIGWAPDWRVLVYAEKIGLAATKRGPKMTLTDVVRDALSRNWDVLAASKGLQVQQHRVRAARAGFYPQVDFAFSHQTIHKELAETSNGTQPWHQGKLAGQLKQFVFVEPVMANLTIQKHLRRGQKADVRRVRLDVASNAALAFLDLLKAQANFEIQRNNARVTDENLERAQVRKQVGSGGPSDVYRWQSQLATDRNNTVLAQTLVANSRVQLNQLTRRPQTRRISAVAPPIWDPTLIPGGKDIRPFVDTPQKFAGFSAFVVEQGLASSPELAQLRAQIKAKEREQLSKARALWLPSVQLSGELSYIPYRKFTDVEPVNIPGIPTPIELSFPRAPRFQWFIGLGLTLPVFTGFRQTQEREKASAELEQLRRSYQSIKLKIEAQLRVALNEVRARSATLFFTRISQRAARKNYRVVRDAYARGVASTVRLLDAQNAALATSLAAASAGYDFQASLVRLQRATGHLHLLDGPKKARAWFTRLRDYLKKRRESSK
jgi:outer membrane protein